MGKLGLILGVMIAGLCFCLPQKTAAVEVEIPKVIINEVMANPDGPDTNKEWLELYCLGDIDLENWQIKFYNDPLSLTSTRTLTLTSQEVFLGDYIVIPNNSSTAITNAKGKIILLDDFNIIKQEISWTKDVGDGYSMEIIGPPYDLSYQKWLKSSVGGTPGLQNSVFGLDVPLVPDQLLPEDNQQFTLGEEIIFSWAEERGVSYECQISQNENFLDLVDIDELEVGRYFWRVKAQNQLGEVYTLPRSFEIIEPVYSNLIFINEILPNPIGDDATGEWIELYNNSQERVNLKNWLFSDSSLSLHTINTDLFIEPWSYLLIPRSLSGLSLNNDGDKIYLYQPNHQLLSQVSYSSGGQENWSWAKKNNGHWSWTTTPSPGALNIITARAPTPPVLETKIVINSVPMEIYTGEAQNYLDKLVKIRGKVISTSGQTFYIDDGSGVVKIYIQSKTGIDKPEMHRNDIFEIIGIVDLYGQTWRILPRFLSDIVLIEKAAIIKTKKTTSKKVASKVVKTIKTPVISKAVAAAATGPPDIQKEESGIANQLVKTVIGLAVIFLAFLIYQTRIQSKIKTGKQIGGHFGDDFT